MLLDMGMTIDEPAVGADRHQVAPSRRSAVVAVILGVAVLGFVIGRASSTKQEVDQWHVGQVVVMASGHVALATPSGRAPVVPNGVAWLDRSGGLHLGDTPECFATPGTVDVRWRQVNVMSERVVVLIDCSR